MNESQKKSIEQYIAKNQMLRKLLSGQKLLIFLNNFSVGFILCMNLVC